MDERIAAAIDRAVTREEIQNALSQEIPLSEREEVKALVRWFTTRYPTAEARLDYVRRAHARWRRSRVRRGDTSPLGR
jgi:hypothetical protein